MHNVYYITNIVCLSYKYLETLMFDMKYLTKNALFTYLYSVNK